MRVAPSAAVGDEAGREAGVTPATTRKTARRDGRRRQTEILADRSHAGRISLPDPPPAWRILRFSDCARARGPGSAPVGRRRARRRPPLNRRWDDAIWSGAWAFSKWRASSISRRETPRCRPRGPPQHAAVGEAEGASQVGGHLVTAVSRGKSSALE